MGHGAGAEGNHLKRSLNLPKSLSFEVMISAVACGAQHSTFVSKDGLVFAFGSNADGQLGVDDKLVQVSSAPLLVSQLKNDGVAAALVSCGGNHTAMLATDGRVFMWGKNDRAQCGVSVTSKTQAFFAP